MRRLLSLVFCFLLLFGCMTTENNFFKHPSFSVTLPEPFAEVPNIPAVCFAPYGDPFLSSSITFFTTELNWYFDSFTKSEYEDSLKSLCGYDDLSLKEIIDCRIDGYPAKRIACRVTIDQGTHDLIVYAISADRIYFFTLLNRDNDAYIDPFDSMMKTLHIKEAA